MELVKIPDTISAALLVIQGYYGNGDARKSALKKDGLDADKVQKCVNDLLPIYKRYA